MLPYYHTITIRNRDHMSSRKCGVAQKWHLCGEIFNTGLISALKVNFWPLIETAELYDFLGFFLPHILSLSCLCVLGVLETNSIPMPKPHWYEGQIILWKKALFWKTVFNLILSPAFQLKWRSESLLIVKVAQLQNLIYSSHLMHRRLGLSQGTWNIMEGNGRDS